MNDPKYQAGDHVFKWTGDYTGPGVVRGIAGLENGKYRYLVGHKIEGGSGEFLHVYAEGNLRPPGRPSNYAELGAAQQWAIDKQLGILDSKDAG